MFVTTATVGDSFRNEPSLSSASATRNSPCPSLALLPMPFNLPPITTVGSSLPSPRTLATRDVVVVFPCAPATNTPYLSLASSASISALGITGIESFFAVFISGLLEATAEDTTTTSASFILAALCPIFMLIPSLLNLLVVSDSLKSEPSTS